ncbi:bifunctional aminodeoxychorismate synthase component I/aminotransferase [Leptospira perolatii]|uniref:Bifunctional aminodeoxychorismate synthase component I/aminotransferase n=1 Tax=Leptospira perolatii TaxID=2023191 RepID=A0A2M9ZR21_9LEPT|nr:bifunctional anthranilate synthase component I family protein/class IV aminotransferase [Leptospira perolatii]PJZ70998.1 bifunctional aminodeoxychorismate synthase component I/aminotransferase [Leptospira perolatii]PJZ74530.1 bifunctional aminodeoxychorismate synthase component I/aminotransferase [Leptospira perolatii]
MNPKEDIEHFQPFLYLGRGFSKEARPILIFPEEVYSSFRLDEIPNILQIIQSKIDQGLLAAGWISYDSHQAFAGSASLTEESHKIPEVPYVWFAVFSQYKLLSDQELENWEFLYKNQGYFLQCEDIQNKDGFKNSIQKIQDYLRSGDVYQINYTFPIKLTQNGSLGSLFFELRKNQKVPYEAWIRTGAETSDQNVWNLMSFSPELFWQRDKNQIRTLPMKGTRPRGKNESEDDQLRSELTNSPKDKAENLMITDLLRNDLGKISIPGSVEVPRLFFVESYETVFQMISEVRSVLKEKTNWLEIVQSLFPGGSITGAPKKRATEIISQLETDRGVYTGAICFLSKDFETVSIAIRTLEFKESSQSCGPRKGRMGIGSGITIDSDAEEEWNECWSKAKFLIDSPNSKRNEFYIFATMLFKRGVIYFLKDHKKRIFDSAIELGFPINEKVWNSVIQEIFQKSANFESNQALRVRLILNNIGTLKSEILPFSKGPKEGPAIFSQKKVSSADFFLRHKTSLRGRFDLEYGHATKKGYLDVLYTNELEKITEGSIHSIFIRKDGEWITPPVSAGLLPGIFRSRLIRKLKCKESEFTVDDLLKAEKIILTNSLRGIRVVTRVDFE